jgi:type II pantothenate kinase
MSCICAGANFLLKNIADESFMYERQQTPHYMFQSSSPNDLYPYLLVTIGSGVSVIKVTSETSFERIGGTATGGGTFWGLGRLLTGAKGFDELLEMATHGDFRKVDMLVKDIYGERDDDYTSSLGLSPTVIASSFGKAIQHDDSNTDENSSMTDADKVRSLLYLVSNDIGQISTLYAMLHNIKRIYFGGFFLRHHPVGLHTISYAVNYWSKGQVSAYFLRHEGYLGAIGAFIKGAGSAYQTDL